MANTHSGSLVVGGGTQIFRAIRVWGNEHFRAIRVWGNEHFRAIRVSNLPIPLRSYLMNAP